MGDAAKNEYPEVVADLAAKLGELFSAKGIANARQLGWDSAILINTELAGQQAYFPKKHLVSARDRRIYKEFTGGNHEELAKKYALTKRQIYNIVNRVRKEDAVREQPNLFG